MEGVSPTKDTPWHRMSNHFRDSLSFGGSHEPDAIMKGMICSVFIILFEVFLLMKTENPCKLHLLI